MMKSITILPKTHLLTCVFLQCVAFLLFTFPANAQTCSPAPVGLVSWWQGENNALDSRSRNNGTLQNGATLGAGNVGQAFDLDGVDDSVQVPHNENQNINGSFSVETWIFPRSVSNNSPRILEKSDGSNRWLLAINQSSPVNALGLTINPSQVALFSPANSIVLNQWSHVAFTYNSSNNEVKLFINGTQVATTTTTAITTTSTNPLVIGNDFLTGTRPFDGLIDEPAIYNSTLSANQIQAIFNSGTAGKCKPTATVLPSGQVGWWSGDGNANDIAGTNNGIFVGLSSFAVGKVGQNFKFDGSQTVEISDNSTLDFTNAFTMEMWVAPTAFGLNDGSSFFISKGNMFAANTQSYGILFGSAGEVVNRVGNGSTIAQSVSNATIPLNTFTHIATTYDGTTLRVYINGVLDNSLATGIGNLLNSSSPLIIGGSNISAVQSAIDETSLYNRALSDSEIASIFNAGIAGKLKTATTPTGFSIADLQKTVNNFSPQIVNTTIGDATVTFPTVTTAGTTQQIPLDTALFPALPMGTHTGLAYDIATSAIFTGNPTVCFNLPAFTPAQFTNLRIFHFEAGAWVNRTSSSNTFPTLCTENLTSLSPFAIVQVAPVAASVSVGGQVFDSSGNAISRARISMTTPSGETRFAITSSFGYYRFDEVEVGQTYVFNIASKRHQFQPQVVSVNDSITDLNFTALP